MSLMGEYKNLEAARVASSNEPVASQVIGSNVASLANNASAIVSQSHTNGRWTYPLTAQANANANVAETMLQVCFAAAKLTSGNITPPSNVAANVASFATLTVYKRAAGASATAVVVATANLSNVAATAWTPLALTVANAANAQVAAGDVLTYTITASAAPGVALPTGTVLDLEYEDV